MVRKEKSNIHKITNPSIIATDSEAKVNKIDLAVLLLYLAVDLIPKLGSIEVMGPQWLYLSVLNLLSSLYLFTRYKVALTPILEKFSNNLLFLVYMSVFILCGLSIFFARNPIESLVVYSRFIITIIAFLNIGLLLYHKPKYLEFLFQAICIIALLQSIPLLYTYLKLVDITFTDSLILSLIANSGNKNIMAASFVIKTPFIIYSIIKYYSLGRYVINTISLLLVATLIFLLNARAAYLGFFLQILLFLIYFLIYQKQSTVKQTVRPLLIILLPILFGLIFSQVLISIPDSNSSYTTIDKRIATIVGENDASSSSRLYLWSNAINLIKERPITGFGYGNYKIESKKYQFDYFNDFIYSKHAHNDFLQLTAEAGILTGLLFFSIFLIALIFTLKVLQSELSSEIKLLSVISLISLAGYFVDAVFNFPAERPIMQIFFVFIIAVNMVMYLETRKSGSKNPTGFNFSLTFLFASCAFSIISIYTCWQTYKSMKVQVLTHHYFGQVQPDVTYLDVNSKFPAIPNLAENTIPINDTKAWYLYRAQKFDEAISILNKDKNASPFSMSIELLKAAAFLDQGKIDSAHFYSKKGFFTRPRSISLFQLITTTSVQLGDTSTIQKAFKEFTKYRNDPKAWKIYLKSLMQAGYDRGKLLKISDSIAKVYPKENEIQHVGYSIRAATSASEGNFSEALNYLIQIMKLYPDDIENFENIGLTYYNLKDYAKAEGYLRKVIEAKLYLNGKSEFFMGICLLQLGRKDEACTFLSQATNRNYPQASLIFKSNNCK